MNILITGANGFIGKALCSRLASSNKVIGVDITGPADGVFNIAWEQADPPASRPPATARYERAGCEALRAGLTDQDSVSVICEKYSPDGFGDLAQ